MNAAVQQIAPSATPANLPVGHIVIAGRIRSKRRINTQNGPLHLTFVTLPAPDEFSSPSTVELRSNSPLGDAGNDVRVKCRIGGRVRSYNKTDPETGESTKGQICNMDLTVIEG